jgi:uncharacterized membrane protein YqjE
MAVNWVTQDSKRMVQKERNHRVLLLLAVAVRSWQLRPGTV